MSVMLKLRQLLEKEHISYQTLEHDPAYTALEIAEAQHLPGHNVVKSVIINADGERWVMCVLSSTHIVDFDKFKKAFSFREVSLANEGQIASLFPNCEVGAMPPFGQLARMPVYMDTNLLENEAIAFNAGTHTDLIRIKLKDYIRLEAPIFGDFSVHI
jgi:Ala-tRNA(Pro) deacylase